MDCSNIYAKDILYVFEKEKSLFLSQEKKIIQTFHFRGQDWECSNSAENVFKNQTSNC